MFRRSTPDAVAPPAPRLSFVLAVYDPPLHLLRRQLDAISAQTSAAWECIAVDDASTDPAVVALLDEWAASDARVTVVHRAENGGIAAATNDGLDRARGEFVAFCDHDDVVAPEAVASIVAAFERHPGAVVVHSDEEIVDGDGWTVDTFAKPDWSPIRHLGQHYLAHLVAARRAAIGDRRVRAEFEPAQDADFYLRVVETAGGRPDAVVHLPVSLYGWRAISGSSALDATEKPEMTDAVRRGVVAALERRGIDATVETVVVDDRPTSSVTIELHGDPGTIDVVEVSATTTSAELDAALRAGDADVVCLVPVGAGRPPWVEAIARELLHDGVAVAGPRLVAPCDGGSVLVSAGRVVAPALDDEFAGEPGDTPGPFGAFSVTREVSAVSPVGAALARRRVLDAGGLPHDVGVHVAFAELAAHLRAAGWSTVVSGSVVVELDPAGRAAAVWDRDDPTVVGDVDDELAVVAARCPGADDERFAAGGLQWDRRAARSVYRDAGRRLARGEVDLVTTDVFDTIVTRPTATPSDAFVSVGRRFAERGVLPDTVTPHQFAEARRTAERRARERVHRRQADDRAPECTLEEIWAEMPDGWTVGDRAADAAIELDVEAELLHPIPQAIDVLERARRRGVPVELVSDVYLSADQLRDVLGRAGVPAGLLEAISTSSGARLGKADGLLRRVIEGHGVDPGRVLHLGDNPIADVATAVGLGAVAAEVDLPRPLRAVPYPIRPVVDRSHVVGSDGALHAAVRATLVDGHQGADPAVQFGAAVAAPMIVGFTRWVAHTAEELGVSTVHCLLREGATIAELLGTVAPDGPATVLVPASRWVTMRAACIDATPDELLTALARRAPVRPEHVVAAFGGDPARIRDLIGEEVAPADLGHACEVLAADDEVRATIVAAAADLRRRVVALLDPLLDLDDGRLVLADVGWGGTIQEGLTRILRAEGVDVPVTGLYLALSAPGEDRRCRGADLRSYLPDTFDDAAAAHDSRTVSHHADTIERVMTPRLGTLVDVAADGTPITRAPSHDPMPHSLLAAQRTVRDVAARLAAFPGALDDPVWLDPGFRAALAAQAARTIAAPSPALAGVLATWPHDDVAGTARKSIGGTVGGATTTVPAILPRMTARDLDLVGWADTSWTGALVATGNPATGAQLLAAARGVDLELLCPPADGGRALLGAFALGSDLAEPLVARVPPTGPGGWSVLRIAGPVDSLRSIRFDAAERAGLVDVEAWRILATLDDGVTVDCSVGDLEAPAIRWVGAHALDRRRFAMGDGGHALVPIDEALAPRVRRVDAAIAFRWWEADGSPLVEVPLTERVIAAGRRVGGAVRRRLPRR